MPLERILPTVNRCVQFPFLNCNIIFKYFHFGDFFKFIGGLDFNPDLKILCVQILSI